MTYPRFRSVVLDTPDARGLAEFYRQLSGFEYRPGDEPPAAGSPETEDFLMLVEPGGRMRLAFQQVADHTPPTWPAGEPPQQLHLDFSVADAGELEVQRERAVSLGAVVLDDRHDDPDEPIYVFADPAGHPFCIFVVAG